VRSKCEAYPQSREQSQRRFQVKPLKVEADKSPTDRARNWSLPGRRQQL